MYGRFVCFRITDLSLCFSEMIYRNVDIIVMSNPQLICIDVLFLNFQKSLFVLFGFLGGQTYWIEDIN